MGSLTLLGCGKAPVAAGPLVFTYTGSAFLAGTPAPPVTFTAVPIGTASADRFVVVDIAWLCAANSASADIGSVTIGGVTATQAVYDRETVRGHAMWFANVPSGTTANVVVGGFSNGFVNSVVANVGIIKGSATTSVGNTLITDKYPNGANALAVTVPSNGVSVISSYADGGNPAATASTSWAPNATKDADTNDGVNFGVLGSMAHLTASATVTATYTGIGGSGGWVAAGFQP